MPRQVSALRSADITNWSGALLPKDVVRLVDIGCIVRIAVTNNETTWTEALYMKVVKKKDGSFWGETQSTYRIEDAVGVPDGKVFAFKENAIMEIPISWQPKWFQRRAAKFASYPHGKRGYSITGLR